MDKQLIAQIFGGIWALNLLIPVVLMFAGLWWNYTFRTDKTNAGFLLQRIKWGFIDRSFDTEEAWATYFFIDVIAVGGCLFLLGAFTSWAGTIGFLVLAALVGFVVVPRFVIDISRALLYNRHTGEAERLARMEREIEQLRAKRDGRS